MSRPRSLNLNARLSEWDLSWVGTASPSAKDDSDSDEALPALPVSHINSTAPLGAGKETRIGTVYTPSASKTPSLRTPSLRLRDVTNEDAASKSSPRHTLLNKLGDMERRVELLMSNRGCERSHHGRSTHAGTHSGTRYSPAVEKRMKAWVHPSTTGPTTPLR